MQNVSYAVSHVFKRTWTSFCVVLERFGGGPFVIVLVLKVFPVRHSCFQQSRNKSTASWMDLSIISILSIPLYSHSVVGVVVEICIFSRHISTDTVILPYQLDWPLLSREKYSRQPGLLGCPFRSDWFGFAAFFFCIQLCTIMGTHGWRWRFHFRAICVFFVHILYS